MLPSETVLHTTMRILLVDDEAGVLRALTRLFERRGHEVRTAASGEAALALLDTFTPDVVVSDHKMSGMTGAVLLDAIGRRLPAARRVLLSGYAEVEGLTGVRFVAKPYVTAELLQACE